MGTLIVILSTVALFHYVYESIIAPAERDYVLYNLNGYRDEIRRMKIKEGKNFNDDLFGALELKILIGTACADKIGVFELIKSAIQKQEPAKQNIQKSLMNNRTALSVAQIEKLKELNGKIDKCCFNIFLINSGGWLPYLIIFLIPMYLISKLVTNFYKRIRVSLRNRINNAMYVDYQMSYHNALC